VRRFLPSWARRVRVRANRREATSVSHASWFRYGVAVLAVGLVLLVRLLLAPLITAQTPFLLLAGGVMLAAWFGGLGPGLLSTALGMLAADYFFLPPQGSFTGPSVAALPLALFAVQGVMISSLAEALRAARGRAEASELDARNRQEKLRRSEERFRLLVQGVEDYAIFMLDPEGRVASWNEGAERIMGYAAKEIIGEHFSVFYTREDAEHGHPEEVLRVATEEGRFEEEGERVRKDGSRFWANVLVSALRDEKENLRGFSKVLRDITERKEAEKELRENEELYRSVVEQATENIFLVDVKTRRIIQANAALHRSLGYSTEELRRLTLHDIVAHDHENIERNVERILEEQRHFIGERQYRRKDGSLMYVEVGASAISYGGREVICVVAHDISERKTAEAALRRSLDALLTLYETGQLLSSSLEREEIGSRLLGIIRQVSGTTAAVINLGDDRKSLHMWRTIGPESLLASVRDEPEARAARRAAFETQEEMLLEMESPNLQVKHLAGLFLPLWVRERAIGVLEIYGSELLSESGVLETFASLANQAASALENAQLYEQLAEHRHRLQNLVGKLVTAQEEERRRVAYEVHDGLAQVAASAYQHLQNFAVDNPPSSIRGEEALNQALELLQQTVGEARNVVADLRPTVLDDSGLATALRLHVERLSDEGLQTSYDETLGGERLPEVVETALFRVAQEALTNVRKHARAERVHVALELRGQTVWLQVRDWGRGFMSESVTVGADPRENVGLSSMRERVALLGGRFEIHSEPGAGTVVVAEVPLPQETDTEGQSHDRE
jgi:PAS domain S-box-containing protein